MGSIFTNIKTTGVFSAGFDVITFFRLDYRVRINLTLFSTVVPSSIFMLLSCRPFVVITTLSTGHVGIEVSSVSWLGQLTVKV